MEESSKKTIVSITIAIIAAIATISAAHLQYIKSKETTNNKITPQNNNNISSKENLPLNINQATIGEKSPIVNNKSGNTVINY